MPGTEFFDAETDGQRDWVAHFPHDIATLIPIITGASGVITNWDGKPAQQGGRIVAAGDPRVREAALKLLNS